MKFGRRAVSDYKGGAVVGDFDDWVNEFIGGCFDGHWPDRIRRRTRLESSPVNPFHRGLVEAVAAIQLVGVEMINLDHR